MELRKCDTKMIQGLSVLAMVYLHLFDRYDYEGLFQPLFFILGYPLSFYFGQLSDFCVMGFAFCSGYSHMAMYQNMDLNQYRRSSWKRIVALYCNYWIVLNLFTLVSILVGQSSNIPGSIWTYLGHFLGLLHSYNVSWWYLFTYVVLVAISPAILQWSKRCHSMIILSVSVVIYFTAFLVRYKSGWDNWFAVQFGKIGMTFFEYIVGVVFYKEKIFTRLHLVDQKLRAKIGTAGRTVIWLVICALLLLGRTLIVPSMIVAPISGMVIIIGFVLAKKPIWLEEIFIFLGKHSTNIWLTHLFFYAAIFVDLVYLAKYPSLIFLFMMVITILISSVINEIMKVIQRHLVEAK